VSSLEELLRRPEVSYEAIRNLNHASRDLRQNESKQIEIEIKYAHFVQRQLKEIEKFKDLEKIRIPDTIEYSKICGLSNEIKEKLKSYRPLSLGQAPGFPE